MRRSLFALLTLSCAVVSADVAHETSDTPRHRMKGEWRRPYNLGFRHREGGGVGFNKGYTTFDIRLFPKANSWWIYPMIDLRAHLFDDRKWAGNAGAGVRFAPRNWCSLFGGNVYYDVRQAPFHTFNRTFHRIGLGLEYLATQWEVRTNGYIPVGRTKSGIKNLHFVGFSGHTILLGGEREKAIYGVDAETGGWVNFPLVRFFGGGGPYFFATGCNRDIYGGRVRMKASYRNFISAEVEGTWDNVYHARGQVSVGINIPLGPREPIIRRGCDSPWVAARFTDRLFDPVERLEILAVRRCRIKAPAIDPATGQPFFVVFVSPTGQSNGTFESPFHDLATAEAFSKPGNVIYVLPGSYSSPMTLQNDQKLWGSGVDHALRTSWGTVTVEKTTAATALLGDPDGVGRNGLLTLGDNNSVEGFVIQSGAVEYAIDGMSVTNGHIAKNTFLTTGVDAINLDSVTGNFTIADNKFLYNDPSESSFGAGLAVVGNCDAKIQYLNNFVGEMATAVFMNPQAGEVVFHAADSNIQATGSAFTFSASDQGRLRTTLINCTIDKAMSGIAANTSQTAQLHLSIEKCTISATDQALDLSTLGGSLVADITGNTINDMATVTLNNPNDSITLRFQDNHTPSPIGLLNLTNNSTGHFKVAPLTGNDYTVVESGQITKE